MTEKKRISWLDSSRGFAFLVVIYCHLEYYNPEIMAYLSPFFLSVFFLVSGYLFKPYKPFGEVLEQRTRTLFLPFLLYGSLLVISQHIFTTKDNVMPLGESLISLWLQNGKMNLIWFIPALYFYSLAYYWIRRWSRQFSGLLVAGILFALANWCAQYIFGLGYLPYNLNFIGYALFWMSLGGAMKIRQSKSDLSRWITFKGFSIALPVYIAIIYFTGQSYGFAASKTFIDWLVVTVLGCYCLIYLSMTVFSRSKFLLFIGANTLLYFILHGKVFAVLEWGVKKIIPTEIIEAQWCTNLLGLSITILDALILIIPIIIINRYLPFTIGKGYKLWGK